MADNRKLKSLSERVQAAGSRVVGPPTNEAESLREKNVDSVLASMGREQSPGVPIGASSPKPMSVDRIQGKSPLGEIRIPDADLAEMSRPLPTATDQPAMRILGAPKSALGSALATYDEGGVIGDPTGAGDETEYAASKKSGSKKSGSKGAAQDIINEPESSDLKRAANNQAIQSEPIPSYDEGGPVDVNDGNHQVAILENGERVLSPDQNDQYESEHGAPAEFPGQVIANPNGIKPMLDTESRAAEPISGAKMRTENGLPSMMNTDNPEPAQLIPSKMQTAGTKSLPFGASTEEEKAAKAAREAQPSGIPKIEGIPSLAETGQLRGIDGKAMPIPQGPAVGSNLDLPGDKAPTTPTAFGPQETFKDQQHSDLEAQRSELKHGIDAAESSGDHLTADNLRLRLQDLNSENPYGSAANHSGILGKIGHGLAKAGNIAGNILAPADMALIPGTDLNKQMQRKSTLGNISQDISDQLKQAETAEKNSLAKNGKPLTPAEQLAQSKLNDSNTLGQITTLLQHPNLKDTDKAVLENEQKQIYARNPELFPPERQEKEAVATAPVIADFNQRVAALGLTGDAAKAYGTAPKGATPTDLQKRYADAAQLHSMTQKDAETKVSNQLRQDAATEHKQEFGERQDAKLINYRDKNGDLVSGTRGEAKDAGVKETDMHGETSPALQEKARQAYTQYDRMTSNAQEAMSTMSAWDDKTPQGKINREQAMNVAKMYWEHVGGGLPQGIATAGINPEYLQQAINSDAYKKMSPAGQEHMQNMFQIWSDAINVVKQETGGVPRGQVFLQKEDAILPHPDKTPAMNEKALSNFAKRMYKDSQEYARPSDMKALQKGIVPSTATHELRDKDNNLVGYVDAKGKDQLF